MGCGSKSGGRALGANRFQQRAPNGAGFAPFGDAAEDRFVQVQEWEEKPALQDDPRIPASLDHRVGVLEAHRHRLLDEHVLSRPCGQNGLFGVLSAGGTERDSIHIRPSQGLLPGSGRELRNGRLFRRIGRDRGVRYPRAAHRSRRWRRPPGCAIRRSCRRPRLRNRLRREGSCPLHLPVSPHASGRLWPDPVNTGSAAGWSEETPRHSAFPSRIPAPQPGPRAGWRRRASPRPCVPAYR